MERYTKQQFTWDVIGETDERYKQGVPEQPVTVTNMAESQDVVSSLIVRQRDRLPKALVEEHERILIGLGIITYGAITAISGVGPRPNRR